MHNVFGRFSPPEEQELAGPGSPAPPASHSTARIECQAGGMDGHSLFTHCMFQLKPYRYQLSQLELPDAEGRGVHCPGTRMTGVTVPDCRLTPGQAAPDRGCYIHRRGAWEGGPGPSA
jgi:hypothetical protein